MWLLPSSPNNGHLHVVHHVSVLLRMKQPQLQRANSFPVVVGGSRSPGQLGVLVYRGFLSEATQEMLEVPKKPQREVSQIFISIFSIGLLSQALWVISGLLAPAFP